MSTNGGREGDHGSAMDRMYRVQRHIYDFTRKFYLLGRDRLIDDLTVPEGGKVLELGCGTGRNLVSVAKAYPDAVLYGIDISAEMLKSAHTAAERAGIEGRTRFAQGDATRLDAAQTFDDPTLAAGFERVFMSYTLSMIPDWQGAIAQGLALTKPGGRLALVDFGNCERLPGLARQGLYAWLDLFHVTPRQDLTETAGRLAREQDAFMGGRSLYRGYATYVTIDRPLQRNP